VRNDSAVQHLSGGIRIPTVSTGELGDFDYAPFEKFKSYLKESYPLVYQNTENYEINTYALVFRIKGKQFFGSDIIFITY
jgi:carboxypeptidase PM20D1